MYHKFNRIGSVYDVSRRKFKYDSRLKRNDKSRGVLK